MNLERAEQSSLYGSDRSPERQRAAFISGEVPVGVYVPPTTEIGDEVFLGPHAVLTDDPYPVRVDDADGQGPVIEDGATIGANATVLPDVTVGENAFVSAGAVVTEDVPANTLAVGTPASHEPLPAELEGGNQLR